MCRGRNVRRVHVGKPVDLRRVRDALNRLRRIDSPTSDRIELTCPPRKMRPTIATMATTRQRDDRGQRPTAQRVPGIRGPDHGRVRKPVMQALFGRAGGRGDQQHDVPQETRPEMASEMTSKDLREIAESQPAAGRLIEPQRLPHQRRFRAGCGRAAVRASPGVHLTTRRCSTGRRRRPTRSYSRLTSIAGRVPAPSANRTCRAPQPNSSARIASEDRDQARRSGRRRTSTPCRRGRARATSWRATQASPAAARRGARRGRRRHRWRRDGRWRRGHRSGSGGGGGVYGAVSAPGSGDVDPGGSSGSGDPGRSDVMSRWGWSLGCSRSARASRPRRTV